MRDDRVWPIVFVLSLTLGSNGCSTSPTEQPKPQPVLNGDVAPGSILIDVLESGRPESYWQYEVRPSNGLVRIVKEETFQDYSHEDVPHVFQQPAGAIETCQKTSEVDSPDGKYAVYCVGSGVGPSPDEFFLIDRKTNHTLYHWKPTEWRAIRGFAWAPNSHSVAFLNKSSYYGKGMIERVSGISGHPVPHDTVFLSVLTVEPADITEYAIRKDVPYAFTRILSWSN
jgi:hypothetical protein